MRVPPQGSTGNERLILTFHGVGDVPVSVGGDERTFWVPQPMFERLLDTTNEVSVSLGLPIEITFDDGNESDFRIALPALLDRGMTAKFFVCAGRLGRRGFVDEEQLRQMRDAGMSIGSHGWGHVDWRKSDDTTLDLEVRVARESLSAVLDQDVSYVALPFGSYDRRVLKALGAQNYTKVYSSDWGIAAGRWLEPRVSWLRTWEVHRLREIAMERPSALNRTRTSLRRLAKRLR